MQQKITAEDLRAMGILPNENTPNRRAHGSEKYPVLTRDDGEPFRIFIVGSCFLGGIVEMFAKAGCKRAADIESADLIVYSGGEDVDPSLYGEKALRGTYFNTDRDEREIDVFTKALALGKPQFGICRGMQFLHVMNGSKLWQHVGHKHSYTHNIVDLEGNVVRASSMHHQMCIEDDTVFPIAYAEDKGYAGEYQSYSKAVNDPTHLDLEAAFYPNIGALAVQGHPEVGGYPDYTIWCLNRIIDWLEDSTTYKLGDNSKTSFDPPEFLKTRITTENN